MLDSTIPEIQRDIESITNKITEYKLEIEKCNNDLHILSVLDQRPNKCKINDCPFISEAYLLSKETDKDEIVDKLSKLQGKILESNDEINKLTEYIQYHQSMSSKAIEYQIICNMVDDLILSDNNYYAASYSDDSDITERISKYK